MPTLEVTKKSNHSRRSKKIKVADPLYELRRRNLFRHMRCYGCGKKADQLYEWDGAFFCEEDAQKMAENS